MRKLVTLNGGSLVDGIAGRARWSLPGPGHHVQVDHSPKAAAKSPRSPVVTGGAATVASWAAVGHVLAARQPQTERNVVVGGLFIAHRTINGSAPCAAHLSRSVLAWLAPTGVEPSRTPTRRDQRRNARRGERAQNSRLGAPLRP